MRGYQQKQILEMLKTLDEARAGLKGLFGAGNYAAALKLLSDAREFAEAITGLIAEAKGEGTETAGLLTRLMAVIKGAFEDAGKYAQCGGAPGEGFFKAWRKLALRIESTAEKELKRDKMEIVFFPYKASMWDSFESVWLAARDDPDCDAYVVPIPYYEVLPDGGLGKERYEGGEYPDYVPVTHWKDYDVETRRPDIAFIHYPYDDMTGNARIHPGFYSARLKEYCGKLAYIPYFVHGGENEPEYYGILPGIVLADYVFLQTEANRQAYINHYVKYDRINGWNGRYGKPEDKFIVMGSPKYDKVINSKREDFGVPEEWARLLRNPDGTFKKAVLYNTHMFTWIENGGKYFDKLRQVFDAFRERDDVVLWWRPHPNTELNFSELCPELLGEYERTISEYKRAGFGIYDDTPDIHRGICLSDCLYGDPSSLTAMFQCAGKPAIMQKIGVSGLPGRQGAEEIIAANLLESGDYYWFMPYGLNTLMRMDKETLEIEYMGFFPGEEPGGRQFYVSAAECGGKLYFAPFAADNMGIYDTVTGEFESVPIPESKKTKTLKEYDECMKFSRAVEAGGRLFMLPRTYPGILIYDADKKTFEISDEWLPSFEKYTDPPIIGYLNGGVFDAERNKFIMSSPAGGVIVELDINTRAVSARRLSGGNEGRSSIAFAGGSYWLMGREKAELLHVSPDTYDTERFDIRKDLEDINCFGEVKFQHIESFGDSLYLAPFGSDRPVKFDLTARKFSYIDGFDPEEPGYAFLAARGKGKLIMRRASGGGLIEYGMSSGVKRELPMEAARLKNPDAYWERIALADSGNVKNMAGCAIREGIAYSLKMILDGLTSPQTPEWLALRIKAQSEFRRAELTRPDGSAGRAIYEYCKKAVNP